MKRRPPTQLDLPIRRRGGKRRGAGRKPKGERACIRHVARPKVTRHTPVHVTLRMHKWVANLRQAICYRTIERALREGRERFGLRLLHFSVQSNHLHLLVEADDARALGRGMQGLNVRIAKTLNQQMMRRGPVFADRYHAHVLRTPAEVKHALHYVLSNGRRHSSGPLGADWMDPFSSARFFDGWRGRPSPGPLSGDAPVVEPRCWLVREGWRRYGPLALGATPGPALRT